MRSGITMPKYETILHIMKKEAYSETFLKIIQVENFKIIISKLLFKISSLKNK